MAFDPITGGYSPSHSVAGSSRPAKPIKVKKTISAKVRHVTSKPKKGKPGKGGKVPAAPAIPQAPAGVTDQALINAAIRSRFAPQEQALGAQLNQNARFSSGVNDWYKNAQAEIAGLRDQGNAAAQQTLGRITAYNSQPTLATATDQQAATARNNLNSEFAAMFGRDATANSDAMNRLAAAYATQQGNTLNQANAQRMGLLGQQGQLGQQKADYGLTYGAQLQAGQQKALSDQQKLELAAKALGLKVDTLNKVQIPLAQSLSKDRTAKQRVSRTNARTQRGNLTERKQQNRVKNALDVGKQAEKALVDAQKLKDKNKPKPVTPAASTKAKTDYDRATAMVRQVYGPKKHFRPNDVADQLATSKHAVPRDLALAAAQLVKNERLGVRGIDDPKLARTIFKRYGIKVPVVRQSPQIGGAVKTLIGKIPGA